MVKNVAINISKITLFASSYIPLILILILQLIQQIITEHKKNLSFNLKTLKYFYHHHYFWIIVFLLALIAVLWVTLNSIINKTYDKNLCEKVEVSNIKNLNAQYIANFFSIYIFPFITLNLISFAGIGTLFILLIVIGYVYIKNDLIYINPILNIFYKFNVYSLEIKDGVEVIEIVLLSKKNRADLKRHPNIDVQKIGYNIYIELCSIKK